VLGGVPSSFPLEVGSLLKPSRGLGSAVSSPCGVCLVALNKMQNLVHSKAVRKPLVAIILSILKCMFYNTMIGPLPRVLKPARPPLNPPLIKETNFVDCCITVCFVLLQ